LADYFEGKGWIEGIAQGGRRKGEVRVGVAEGTSVFIECMQHTLDRLDNAGVCHLIC